MSKKLRLGALVASILILAACAKDKAEEDNRYIVVMKRPIVAMNARSDRLSVRRATAKMLEKVADKYELDSPKKIFSVAVQGGVYELTEDQVESLANDPDVAYVEKDHRISVYASQANAPWGLDRIDQADLPLNLVYNHQIGGAPVNAYVIDTGVLHTHQDFGGRAVSGVDLVDGDSDSTDCNGHGTHVAGSIGGSTFGVSKSVKIHGVRVLDCMGSGNLSDVIAGIEWVTANHVKPAVANMSLGGPLSQAIDDAVAASIAAGVVYVVAAGNENQDACRVSPARVPGAITVGSTERTDRRSSFSNFGACVDIFAPGSDILSAWSTSVTATQTISGTSMASPHVAGAVALYLAQNPQATPTEVAAALTAGAGAGRLTSVGAGSPNLLLNIAFADSGGGDNGGDDGGGDNGGGDGGNNDGDPSKLANGVAKTALSGAKGDEKFFTIEVPANSENLIIEISGGSGDVDLYLKAGAKPSLSVYDCRPFRSGNTEKCTVAAPMAGIYHVLLRGYSSFSGVTLKASFQARAGTGAPCTACDKFTGVLNGKGASEFRPTEYSASTGQQQFWLSGPAGADFDLYLYKKSGSSWQEVARSVGLSSSEKIVYQGAEGVYRLKVISYAGSGAYELFRKLP